MRSRKGQKQQLGRGTFRIFEDNTLVAMVTSSGMFSDPLNIEYWAFTEDYDPPQVRYPQEWRIERVYPNGLTLDDFIDWAEGEAAITGIKMSLLEWLPYPSGRRKPTRKRRGRRP